MAAPLLEVKQMRVSFQYVLNLFQYVFNLFQYVL